MHAVVDRAQLSPNVTRLVIEAPRIAEIRQPGQFVIVHRAPGAERIPLTIADADPQRGTITLVIQAVGKSTEDLVPSRSATRSRMSRARSGEPRSCLTMAGRSASAVASARPLSTRSRSGSPPAGSR